MKWIKKKYYALQLYIAACQMGDKKEADAQILYFWGLDK